MFQILSRKLLHKLSIKLSLGNYHETILWYCKGRAYTTVHPWQCVDSGSHVRPTIESYKEMFTAWVGHKLTNNLVGSIFQAMVINGTYAITILAKFAPLVQIYMCVILFLMMCWYININLIKHELDKEMIDIIYSHCISIKLGTRLAGNRSFPRNIG